MPTVGHRYGSADGDTQEAARGWGKANRLTKERRRAKPYGCRGHQHRSQPTGGHRLVSRGALLGDGYADAAAGARRRADGRTKTTQRQRRAAAANGQHPTRAPRRRACARNAPPEHAPAASSRSAHPRTVPRERGEWGPRAPVFLRAPARQPRWSDRPDPDASPPAPRQATATACGGSVQQRDARGGCRCRRPPPPPRPVGTDRSSNEKRPPVPPSARAALPHRVAATHTHSASAWPHERRCVEVIQGAAPPGGSLPGCGGGEKVGDRAGVGGGALVDGPPTPIARAGPGRGTRASRAGGGVVTATSAAVDTARAPGSPPMNHRVVARVPYSVVSGRGVGAEAAGVEVWRTRGGVCVSLTSHPSPAANHPHRHAPVCVAAVVGGGNDPPWPRSPRSGELRNCHSGFLRRRAARLNNLALDAAKILSIPRGSVQCKHGPAHCCTRTVWGKTGWNGRNARRPRGMSAASGGFEIRDEPISRRGAATAGAAVAAHAGGGEGGEVDGGGGLPLATPCGPRAPRVGACDAPAGRRYEW